jgi:hypothetical protein
VGILKYSSLMGTFLLPPHDTSPSISQINMISTSNIGTLESYDPWVVPIPTQYDSYGDQMPLSLIELYYQEI